MREGTLFTLKCLCSTVFVLSASCLARGQRLYVPLIPQHLHGEFVAALGLDEVESRLADVAFANYTTDRADADRAYSVRMQ